MQLGVRSLNSTGHMAIDNDYDSYDDGGEVNEFQALSRIIRALQGLPPEARQRVIASVATFLGLDLSGQRPGSSSVGTQPIPSWNQPTNFSEDRAPSPKDFLFDKKPQTDIDRVTCLAYYLTHYRDTPHFKTLDISKINTEAAQLKLSNAANTVENATRIGLLVPASKGAKQLSAIGELYVQALPDRAAAKEVLANTRPRKRTRRGKRGTITRNAIDENE
jgi:hypothetical protein